MNKIYFYFFLTFLCAVQMFPQGSGKALEFDGSVEYVTIPNSPSFEFSAGTLEAWLCPNASGDNEIFLSMRTSSSTRWSIHIRQSAGIIGIANASTFQPLSVGTITANKWMHVAIYMTTTDSYVYVNGVYKGTVVAGISTAQTGIPLTIGLNDGGNYWWECYPGKIDEVRIWDDERTATEIQENMCKTLAGNEANLVAYYKMSNGSGSTLSDNTSNGHDGTLTSMESGDWITSGAAIGDASTYNYSSPSSVNLASGNGDDVTVSSITGSPSGVQIYRVDEAPNVTTPPGSISQLSASNYFGVFIAGGTSPTYTLTYNYDGHPGISNETTLDLAKRTDNSTTSWTEGNATLNTTANTLTLTGQSGTEYILGSEASQPLPVELTSFNANVINNKVSLNWNTATEKDNYGFEVEKSVGSASASLSTGKQSAVSNWEKLGFVNGHGNSNSPKDYFFTDNKVTSAGKYCYRLKQIDSDGSFEYSDVVEVDFGQPNKFELMQNYPNPFNPSTKISYTVPQDSKVRLTLFNTLGQEIAVLEDGFKEAGFYNYQLSIDNYQLQSGVYFYELQSNDTRIIKKLLLLK